MNGRIVDEVDAITAPDAERMDAASVREYNFGAVYSVVEAVRTTLGPRGKDKMIEQPDGSVLIVNDASTVLDEIAIAEPAASLAVEAADAVGREFHDGTTTAVVICGALLEEAEGLLDRGLHPNTIVRGYERASDIARQELEALATPIGSTPSALRSVATTAMTGTGAGMSPSEITDLVVSATGLVEASGAVDADHVRVVTRTGYPTADSRVVEGAVLTDDPVRESMPRSVADATVLLTRDPVQLSDTGTDTAVKIGDAESFDRFLDQEAEQVRGMVETLVGMGVDVVLCSDSIADEAQSAMSVNGILGVRRVDDEALRATAAVLGGTVVSSLPDATTADLGTGRIVRDEDDGIFLVYGDGDGSGETRATILLCGPTEEVVDELARHAGTGLEVVASGVDEGIVAGGGATEIELAARVRDAASGVRGREQLAVEAFANALEAAVRVLVENVGRDPVDVLTALRSAHAGGTARTGIGAHGELIDTFEADVHDPAAVKRQAIDSATAAATLLIGVDDLFFVGELSAGDDDDDGADD